MLLASEDDVVHRHCFTARNQRGQCARGRPVRRRRLVVAVIALVLAAARALDRDAVLDGTLRLGGLGAGLLCVHRLGVLGLCVLGLGTLGLVRLRLVSRVGGLAAVAVRGLAHPRAVLAVLAFGRAVRDAGDVGAVVLHVRRAGGQRVGARRRRGRYDIRGRLCLGRRRRRRLGGLRRRRGGRVGRGDDL